MWIQVYEANPLLYLERERWIQSKCTWQIHCHKRGASRCTRQIHCCREKERWIQVDPFLYWERERGGSRCTRWIHCRIRREVDPGVRGRSIALPGERWIQCHTGREGWIHCYMGVGDDRPLSLLVWQWICLLHLDPPLSLHVWQWIYPHLDLHLLLGL